MIEDRPRLLRDEGLRRAREAQLNEAHIRPLTGYVESLRAREGDFGYVPYFDSWDGGINARALFLFEKPGPKAAASGFISRNNDDATAESTFSFMIQAGIPREATCLWNLIPGWNKTIRIDGSEIRNARAIFGEFLDLLPKLRVVVLVGRQAQTG